MPTLLVALLCATPARAALLPTSSTIGSSANPTCAGKTIVLVSRVSSPVETPVEPTPFGTVAFADGGAVMRQVPLDNDGVARFGTSLAAGTHRITATYSGDLLYSPSTSGQLSVRVEAGCGGGSGSSAAKAPPPGPLIAAAGDISCDSSNPRFNRGLGSQGACQELWTSNLIGNRGVSAVLPLGDLQQEGGDTLESFLRGYAPSWGRWRSISHPVPGNHEYDDPGARGYWDYWNGAGNRQGRAGRRGRGWYSYDLGSWHLVALNSNCGQVSCRGRSRQLKWLRKNLRRNRRLCTLAYMHFPRFSSGYHAMPEETARLWRVLYRHGADVVLNGHDHLYERFAPQRPSGVGDRRHGITQFTVGTGGYVLFPLSQDRAPNSQFLTDQTFGDLFMRLNPRSFEWSFINLSGQTIDEGARRCHPARHRHRHGHHHGHGR